MPLTLEELTTALGKISINFNSLEMHLSLLIWVLLGLDTDIARGKAVTSELSFQQKINLFASLYQLAHKKIKEPADIQEVIKKLKKAEKDRNDALHSMWLSDLDGKTVTTRYKISAKAKRGLRDEFDNKVSKESLDEMLKTSRELTSELMGMFSTYRGPLMGNSDPVPGGKS